MILSQQSVMIQSTSSTQICRFYLKQYFLISLQKLQISAYSYFLKNDSFSSIASPILLKLELCTYYYYALPFFTSLIKLSKNALISPTTVNLLWLIDLMQAHYDSCTPFKMAYLPILSSKMPDTFFFSYVTRGNISSTPSSCTLMFLGWFLVCSEMQWLHRGSKCQALPTQTKVTLWSGCFVQAQLFSWIITIMLQSVFQMGSTKIIPSLEGGDFLLQLGNRPLPFCDLRPDHVLGGLVLVLLFLLRGLLDSLFLDLQSQTADFLDQVHVFLHDPNVLVLVYV